MRKLSWDGEREGFETDTVPFISISGPSERRSDIGDRVFVPDDGNMGNMLAIPAAVPANADFWINFRLVTRSFFSDFIQ
jgi:hypothetical protein